LDNVNMDAGIGETLRQARLAAGIDLEEAERTIRIRIRYLHALESEEWAVLPGDAYARGFLRTYADFLGLDGNALVDEYDRHAVSAQPDHHPAELPLESPVGPAGPRDGRVWSSLGMVALAAAAGLAALFVVLALTGGSDDDGKEDKPSGAAQRTTKTTTTPEKATLNLSPTGTVWVCLVNREGRPVVNGETLTNGDSRGPFKDTELKLTLGNGAMDIELNGEPVPVPAAANPVGFVFTPEGSRPLAAADRPTCS
jgi:cytoskeleton protein RodZ